MRDFLKFMLKGHPGYQRTNFSVVLIEVMQKLLLGLPGYLSEQTDRILISDIAKEHAEPQRLLNTIVWLRITKPQCLIDSRK